MENIKTIKAIVTGVAALLSALLGTLYIPVLLMILCNIIDYATGLMAAKNRPGRRYQFLSQYQRNQEKGIYVAARSRWSYHGSIAVVCIADDWY